MKLLEYLCKSATWTVLTLFFLAVVVEYGGVLHLYQRIRYGLPTEQKISEQKRDAAYRPFAIQHLNPFTLFSFPLSHPESLSNDQVTLTPEGFRGTMDLEGRKLAFLLGGSTAFGYLASSDATTIDGYLNVLQTRYHFLNAAVPSWNTTQELHRLLEILDYSPSLVITVDGSNDIAIAQEYALEGRDFPVGTPEYFGTLTDLISPPRRFTPILWGGAILRRIFPALSRHVGNALFPAPPSPPLSEETVESLSLALADRYLQMIKSMQQLVTANGGVFHAFLQPVQKRNPLYERTRAHILAGRGKLPIHDLMGFFDDSPSVFLDNVHLTDRGNRRLAETISRMLR